MTPLAGSALGRLVPATLMWVAGTMASGSSLAYKPEIGDSIKEFPIVHAAGQAFDWSPASGSFRILIIGTSWCPPCQDLKTSLPNELARVRQGGVNVSAVFVNADDLGGSANAGTQPAPGPNRFGYLEAKPDPKRIDLAKESPKGVRQWGDFYAYGYPTTILLDDRNVVVGRYRGGRNSQGVFDDVLAVATRTGVLSAAPVAPAVPSTPRLESSSPPRSSVRRNDRAEEQVGDELIGLWKVNNPEAKDPSPLFLRVIGVSAEPGGAVQLEASLSYKLTKWMPVAARCESAQANCSLRLTTPNGGDLTAKRQPDGTYAGTLAITVRSRTFVRPITIEPMSLDQAEL